MKVERVSYDVITPSAARGVLEAIYWHPGLRWHVDKIYVLSPIKMTNIRRNEVQSKISKDNIRAAMTGGKNNLYIERYCPAFFACFTGCTLRHRGTFYDDGKGIGG